MHGERTAIAIALSRGGVAIRNAGVDAARPRASRSYCGARRSRIPRRDAVTRRLTDPATARLSRGVEFLADLRRPEHVWPGADRPRSERLHRRFTALAEYTLRPVLERAAGAGRRRRRAVGLD